MPEHPVSNHHPAVITHRRNLLKLMAAGALASGGMLGLIREVLANGSGPNRKQGIYKLEGTVTFNGKPKQVGDLVSLPVQVVTGAKSAAVFVVGEDAYMVRPNSKLTLTGNEKGRTSDIKLLAGGLLSVFAKGEVTLSTTTATAGIRGTGIYMESWPKKSYVCLCYGWVKLMPTGREDLAQKFNTTHHESPRMIYPDRMENMPVENHTDDELYLLESLTGRIPPFWGQAYGYGSEGILGDIAREKRYKEPDK